MSITIQLDLPDDIAAEARSRGLLEPERLAEMISAKIAAKRDGEFFETARKLRSTSGEPMSLTEIQAIVDEVRTERLARETGH